MKNITWKHLLGTAAALLWVNGAAAQANPESGDVAPPPAVDASASGSASATTSWPSPSASSEASSDSSGGVETGVPEDPSGSDHAAVVGHLGVGFFGIMELPLPNNDEPLGNVAAPTIGVRYWLDDMLGIEAALGLNITSRDLNDTDSESEFGLALHGGVPLALAASGHFVFEIVPFLNFGIASGSREVMMGMATAETDYSGLLIEVGGRVGAEIHFGFIDLPSLSLQGSVGLSVRHESRGIEMGDAEADAATTVVSTGVYDDPWDIFTGNIAAIYYL